MTEGEPALGVFFGMTESGFFHLAFIDPHSMTSLISPVSTMLSSRSHPSQFKQLKLLNIKNKPRQYCRNESSGFHPASS